MYDYIIDKPSLDDLILEHYGVKGMRWRHRKGRKKTSASSRRRKDINSLIKSTYEEQKREAEERNENAKKNAKGIMDELQYQVGLTKLGQFLRTPIKDTFTKKAYASDKDNQPSGGLPDGQMYEYKKDSKTGKWVPTGRKIRTR